MNKKYQDIMLQPKIESKEVTTTLEQISEPLEEFVKFNKLPTDNVLATNVEKTKLFNNFSGAIEQLTETDRMQADYLTKFIVASAVGLFDGALNFLWDEIIRSLRTKVIQYDLIYFYSVAEQQNAKYKNLKSPEDLQYISDYDLLSILKRMDFIDEIAFKALENINYLRNNASAAHPNTNELSGLKLSSLLEDGIKYAILIEPNNSMITIRKLFNNIRTLEIPDDDYDAITEELLKISQNRLDDFANSIFGLYCDIQSGEMVQKNIIEISKRIWQSLSEMTKYNIGSRFGFYRKNGDVPQKNRVNVFLEKVGGLKYKDTDSIVAELIDLLNQLRTVHFALNNFYNEYYYARDIEKIIPSNGIPAAIKNLFIKTICICYAGNGHGYREGVDEGAVEIYEKFIHKFNNEEIKIFLTLFLDSDFTIDFYKSKPDKRIRQVCKFLKNNTTNEDLIIGLDIIINFTEKKLNTLIHDVEYTDLIKKITN